MPSIIPWRTSPPSCAGTPLAPKLHRVPLPNKDPEDDIILFMATKDPATPAMHARQRKTSSSSKPPPVLKSCLKKRDPSPSSSSTTSSSASSASSSSYPRSPPPQFRSREDVAIYSESETSPTRLKGYRGRHLRSLDGVESDCEKSGTQMRHPRNNLKNSSTYPLSAAATHPITLHWSLIRYNPHMSRQCIRFDICLPPRDNIRDFYTGKHWVESDYLKLASKPALDEMLIRCEVGLVSEPWNIYVNRKGGIRIIDVFEKIYDSFSIVLNDDEKKKLNPHKMKYYDRAFRRRCAITPGLTLHEERKGMKRVDLLEGLTVFMGLELSASRDCWLLRLGSSPTIQ